MFFKKFTRSSDQQTNYSPGALLNTKARNIFGNTAQQHHDSLWFRALI